jgi:hypothetical protein
MIISGPYQEYFPSLISYGEAIVTMDRNESAKGKTSFDEEKIRIQKRWNLNPDPHK